MASRSFGRITVTTPDLDDPGLYLSLVETLENPRGIVQDFAYGDADLRSLALTGVQLITGRVSDVRAERVRFESLNLHGVEIIGSELGSLHWSEGRLTRVHFRDCRLMGATLDGVVLDDVLFEECRLDYATVRKVRAGGPVAFVGCAFTEGTFTDCDLSGAVFSDCGLRLTEFGGGRYRGVDLRGSDLSRIRGVANLAEVRIDPGQHADLAQALVGELGITIGDD
ncbi:pentapeptide repeat-containing protein [Streptomyces lichenis]|uniref:Pentapeptide repeat-containing protein n=1 Tax=Streptomyces lichenis TaxID=2306967 RepID=A0ABT0II31_9ACTN|nr:pentapeptide repeat-containing protein [Streptomyces lichenis]MCK8680973.1 pentapeptide repeat-containing protein [Streptomyces lichenis]